MARTPRVVALGRSSEAGRAEIVGSQHRQDFGPQLVWLPITSCAVNLDRRDLESAVSEVHLSEGAFSVGLTFNSPVAADADGWRQCPLKFDPPGRRYPRITSGPWLPLAARAITTFRRCTSSVSGVPRLVGTSSQ